uniref:Uncharacterized protein n=1 Tax=Arundo donax TaxID=35708 RepID=A0A0A8ZH59_ARUDO
MNEQVLYNLLSGRFDETYDKTRDFMKGHLRLWARKGMPLCNLVRFWLF